MFLLAPERVLLTYFERDEILTYGVQIPGLRNRTARRVQVGPMLVFLPFGIYLRTLLV